MSHHGVDDEVQSLRPLANTSLQSLSTRVLNQSLIITPLSIKIEKEMKTFAINQFFLSEDKKILMEKLKIKLLYTKLQSPSMDY